MHWKTLETKSVEKNSYLEVTKNKCEKPNGDIVEEYYVVKRPDVAIIIAFTEKMELVMVYQYRFPVNSIDFEVPAGYAEPNENEMVKAAERELLEETGYKSESLKEIKIAYASSGLMNSNVHFFIGLNAKKVQEINLDQNEELEVKVLPWKEALQLYEDNKIKDLGSITAILIAKKYLEENEIK